MAANGVSPSDGSGRGGIADSGWFKSRHSNGSDCCVEVRFGGAGTVFVRDSKFRRGRGGPAGR